MWVGVYKAFGLSLYFWLHVMYIARFYLVCRMSCVWQFIDRMTAEPRMYVICSGYSRFSTSFHHAVIVLAAGLVLVQAGPR
ncbi:hypothetical protein J3F84DRAFT_320654 [Trichoderma pleuroticola]